MLEEILKKVERINKKIHEVSNFNYLGLSGMIILNEEWMSFGVLLMDDEREILFSISDSGQLKALHESNQKLVSGLRLKILGLMDLMKERDSMFREFVSETSDQSIAKDAVLASEMAHIGNTY